MSPWKTRGRGASRSRPGRSDAGGSCRRRVVTRTHERGRSRPVGRSVRRPPDRASTTRPALNGLARVASGSAADSAPAPAAPELRPKRPPRGRGRFSRVMQQCVLFTFTGGDRRESPALYPARVSRCPGAALPSTRGNRASRWRLLSRSGHCRTRRLLCATQEASTSGCTAPAAHECYRPQASARRRQHYVCFALVEHLRIGWSFDRARSLVRGAPR